MFINWKLNLHFNIELNKDNKISEDSNDKLNGNLNKITNLVNMCVEIPQAIISNQF